jgi:hypothetical protein
MSVTSKHLSNTPHTRGNQAVRGAGAAALSAEIGVWMERSIIFMAQTLKRQGKRVKMYAIDTFKSRLTSGGAESSKEINGGILAGRDAQHKPVAKAKIMFSVWFTRL